MKIRMFVLMSALALVACDKEKEAPAPDTKTADAHDAFTDFSPDQVEGMISKKECVVVDTNSSDIRKEHGMVPGAVQLSSYDEYKSSELPDDKATKLVFYCGSQKCSAAPKAAKVAIDAGYKDVNVMRAGIKGWVAAGKKVDKPTG